MEKLAKLALLHCILLCAALNLGAQSVTTDAISFRIEDVSELFMPPELYMDVKFSDTNGNDILEAEESGKIIVNISNRGGKADGVKVNVIPADLESGVVIGAMNFVTDVPEEGSSVVEIPLTASINVPTGYARFDINVSESMGYDITAVMELSTFAYQKSELKINGVSIIDSGKGLRALNNNPDGKMQKGEVVRASVLLQNVGVGEATNIKYKIESKDPNVFIVTESGYTSEYSGAVGSMLVEQTREVSFRLSANNNYVDNGEFLPVYLTVTEEKGLGNIESQQIPIPMDAIPVKPEIVKVEADTDKLLASLGTKVYSDDKRVTSDSQIKDIMVAPYGERLYSDAYAIVIGSEKYMDGTIPKAPYAARDAQVMAEYFKNSMGIENVRLLTDNQVTSMELNTMFDAKRGRLSRIVHPGETELFVYYSGHGVPMETDEGGKDIFLIPYDVEKTFIRDYGFSLNKMYSELASLNAKSVTVIIDACFSGGSRPSDSFKSESIANQKLVVMDTSEMEQPWLNNPNFRVFTSSRGDQTSQGYDRSLSGLFTYYLAVGMQGEADKNADGTVTMTELVDYVTVKVDETSEGRQTPQFYGNSDFVVEKIR